MSNELDLALVIAFAEVVPAAILFYAAYWAFSIQHALMTHIYRNQALWMGVLAILFGLSIFLTYSTNPVIYVAIGVFYAAFFLVIFRFVDSLVPVARRADPMLRSIIRWEKLRAAFWVAAGALSVLGFLGSIISSPLASGLFILFAVTVFGISAIAIVTGWRRSGDETFRRYLKWLGVSFILLVAVIVEFAIVSAIPGVTQFDLYYSYDALPAGVLDILAAYALYRSARSLAPTNPLQPLGQTD